jgi:hypothetical protein
MEGEDLYWIDDMRMIQNSVDTTQTDGGVNLFELGKMMRAI